MLRDLPELVILLLALGALTAGTTFPDVSTRVMSFGSEAAQQVQATAIVITGSDVAGANVVLVGENPALVASLETGTYSLLQEPSQTATTTSSSSVTQSGLAGEGNVSLNQYVAVLAQKWPAFPTPNRKNRNRFEIYARMIEITTFDPLTVTQIALHLRMNFTETKDCLNFLAAKGLLLRMQGVPTCYRATERGGQFLEIFRLASRFLT